MKGNRLFLFFLFLSVLAHGQICEGNLGDNIFESGDFGVGLENNIKEDPQIAPGYQY